MAHGFDEVRAVLDRFIMEYWGGLYGEYINSCAVSRVTRRAPPGSYTPEEADDYCISIGLIRPFPEGVALPERYEGIRVFTRPENRAIAQ